MPKNSSSIYKIMPTTIWTLNKGLFSDRHVVDIPPQGCSEVNNLVYLYGYLRPRPGYVEDFTTNDTTPVHHLSQYTPLTGSPELIRVTRNTSGDLTCYHYSSGWNAISGGNIVGGNTSDVPCFSVNFKGKWFLVPGDQDLLEYDGVSISYVNSGQPNVDLRPPSKPRLIATNDARIFLANVVDGSGQRIPYRIAWSDFLNEYIWGGGFGAGSSAFVDLAGESDPITAIYAFGNAIIVFKPRVIYVGSFVGPPQFYAFRRLVRGPGCISQATLKEYRDGLLVWLGDDNVYIGLPGQRPQPIANSIYNRIRDVVSLSGIEKTRALLDRDNHLYTLFMPDLNGKVIKLFTVNLTNLSWWEGVLADGSLEITDGFTFRSSSWTETRLVGTKVGKILKQDLSTYTDDNTPYSTKYVTGVFSYERMSQGQTQQADVQLLRVQAKPAPAPASVSNVDFTLWWGNSLDRFQAKTFGNQKVDGSSDLYVPGRQTSENFKIELSTNDARDCPFIAGIGFGIIPEGDTRYLR